MTTRKAATERMVQLAELFEGRLGTLRLRQPQGLRQLRRSLIRYGQLKPVVAYASMQGLELIDGFKRLHVARQLGWNELRVLITDVDSVSAKLLVVELHSHHGLSVIEEGWLIRSLYREEGMAQGQIAVKLGRHKSWVCRRLLFVEQLDDTVQADVRLGLLAPRAAMALAALPRGNQQRAAEVAVRSGLTVRQTEKLVADLTGAPDEKQFENLLGRWTEGRPNSAHIKTRRSRSTADVLAWEAATIKAASARLSSRLMAIPLSSVAPGAQKLLREQLNGLICVLVALRNTIEEALDKTRGNSLP